MADGSVERRVVEVGRARVAYRVGGAGPAVVLLHGLGGSGRWWGRNVPALAARYRVHVVDLVGFGESRGGGPFAIAGAEEILLGWLDRLGLERVALVGHSMGGRIAAELAADAPARVERLVLVNAALFAAGGERARRLPVWGLAGSWRSTAPDFLPLLALDALRTDPRAFWRAAIELLTTDAEAKLPRVSAPTLLVWGERDTLVPPAVGERIARLLPRAELVSIPGAGHNPMWERAAVFNELLLGFLAPMLGEGAVAGATGREGDLARGLHDSAAVDRAPAGAEAEER